MSSMIIHPFLPVADESSRVLILGSFPSVKSRENNFYYGHPKNRFWPVLATLLKAEVPATVEEKRRLVLSGGIALWDTIAQCEIRASEDASIKKETPNDIPGIVKKYAIEAVVFNGKASFKYFQKYFKDNADMESVVKIALPSTSPANAAVSLEELQKIWGEALEGYIR